MSCPISNFTRCPDGCVGSATTRRNDVGLLALLLPQPPRPHEWHLDAAAGLGQVTVRAQIQAITVAFVPSAAWPSGRGGRCASRPRRASMRRRRGRPRRGPRRRSTSGSRDSASPGKTGGWSRNFGGISISALLISTATGLRSEACASKPEPLCLQRDRAAARERVEDRRRVAVGGLQDLGVGLGEQLLVADVLPHDQPLDELVEPLALLALSSSVGNSSGRARVVDELGEQHRARRRQRAPRPPQVQRRGVPVPDRLLPRRLPVDRLQRQTPPRSACASAPLPRPLWPDPGR